MENFDGLLARYREVERRVCGACERSSRERSAVTLVAVSKTKPEEQLRALLAEGAVHFGENKVQDLCRKMQDITPENGHTPVWHMLGTLQTNKVKYLVGSPVRLIHSVDSVHLAEALSREAEKKKLSDPVDILLEINIGGEATKAGFRPEEAKEALHRIAGQPLLRVCGLMTVCPPGTGEENRGYFRAMRRLRDELAAEELPGTEIKELSMGMSRDYEAAIEEGATIVRVGTVIFGERNYAEPEWTPAMQEAKDAANR